VERTINYSRLMVSYHIIALAILCAILHLATRVVSAFNTGRYHRAQKQYTSYAQNKYLPRRRSFEICMSSDEDIETQHNDNPIKQYFNNINSQLSSSLKSTSQTDALGKQQRIKEEGDDVPPEVLQPFSLLLLSQFILFLGVGAVIPTIPLYGQSIGLSAASNGVVISAPGK